MGAAAKLLHLISRGEAAQSRHTVHQADWIAGRLNGCHGTSDENNALKLGFDPVTRRWPAWLDRLGVPSELLPRVMVPGTAFAGIYPTVARTLGLPRTARVVAGTTDGVASFIANRADQPGDGVTSLGTTLVVKLLAAQPIFAAAASSPGRRSPRSPHEKCNCNDRPGPERPGPFAPAILAGAACASDLLRLVRLPTGASVLIRSEAAEAASCSAVRTTLAGSTPEPKHRPTIASLKKAA